MRATLKVVAWQRDGGDGSQTVRFFNDKEELSKYLATAYGKTTLEDIESEDDPYENGLLTELKIEVEIDESFDVRLLKPFSASFG